MYCAQFKPHGDLNVPGISTGPPDLTSGFENKTEFTGDDPWTPGTEYTIHNFLTFDIILCILRIF